MADEAVGAGTRGTTGRRRRGHARRASRGGPAPAATSLPSTLSAGDAEAARPAADVGAGGDLLPRRVLAVEVVLADEQHRQREDARRSSGTRGSSPGWSRRRRRRRPRRSPLPRSARPAPVAAAMLPPTIPKQPIRPCSRSMTFIEPARPPQVPVARPISSAASPAGRCRWRARGRGRGRWRPRGRPARRPRPRRPRWPRGRCTGAWSRGPRPQEQALDLVLEAADPEHRGVGAAERGGVLRRGGRRLHGPPGVGWGIGGRRHAPAGVAPATAGAGWCAAPTAGWVIAPSCTLRPARRPASRSSAASPSAASALT